ncbi:MAG TPA: tail fiber domain-containing protein [Acidobacteriaceae bacterium]|jgi:hypothetical protein|nr:tail fiber domain-containing protein [Acidobacteriaceae bacterium]
MKTSIAVLALAAATGLFLAPLPTSAQTSTAITSGPAPEAAAAPTSVPALIKYSGLAFGEDGKPLGSPTSMTFLVFTDQQSGAPVFTESQDVPVDTNGRYTVELGATLPNGIPAPVFANGDARWLEVQMAGQNPQPRVLLLSVPYALKAGDATTLGGLPVSAFALAGSVHPAAATVAAASNTTLQNTTSTAVTTTGGTSGYLSVFTGASVIADSNLFQDSTGVGIGTQAPAGTLDVNGASYFRGNVQLSHGATTAAAGANSVTLTFATGAWNSKSSSVVSPKFVWLATPTGNNTTAPSAILQLQTNLSGPTLANTGFYFNADGSIHFAANQTFPGTGTGTITGITAGTGLTGGGTGGAITLAIDPAKIPQLAASANTFTGSLNSNGLSVTGNATVVGALGAGSINTSSLQATTGQFSNTLNAAGVVIPPTAEATAFGGTTSSSLDLQTSTFSYNTYLATTQTFRWQAEPTYPGGTLNLLYGSGAAAPQETGINVTPNGTLSVGSLVAASSGTFNGALTAPSLLVAQPQGTVASPELVIQADETGQARHAASQLVIQGASYPGQQLLIGEITNANSSSGGTAGTIQSTWNGVENTPLLLNPNGGGVYIQTQPGTGGPLVVGQGAGAAVADGWYTYSSRRFKTNIETLQGALGKVEKLRGVSYTLKATGKQEIGVIAEEVGAVVPQVVKYEPNGKDATGVDYERLTALLIESTKQQQREINQLSARLNTAVRHIDAQQRQIHRQAATINALAQQVRAGSPSLEVASIHSN